MKVFAEECVPQGVCNEITVSQWVNGSVMVVISCIDKTITCLWSDTPHREGWRGEGTCTMIILFSSEFKVQ